MPTYAAHMSEEASSPVSQPQRLPAEVLAALVEAAQQRLRHLDGDCLTHATGRVTWLGLTAKVKPLLFEHHFGHPVPSGSMLLRRCLSPGCVEPTHHVSVPRSEWGSFLGRPGGAWRPHVA